MPTSNAYSSLCLFILKDDQLQVLLDMSGSQPSLPILQADPAQDIDLAFTCRRISKDLIGKFDYQIVPIHTYSGTRMPDIVEGVKGGWPVLQSFAGIGRADELPADIDCNTFMPVDMAVDMITPSQAGVLNGARAHLMKIAGTSKIPAMLLSREFTLPEMRKAYEVVSEFTIQDTAFRRKVLSQHFIQEVGERRGLQTRPAKTYQLIGVRMDFDRNIVFSDPKS